MLVERANLNALVMQAIKEKPDFADLVPVVTKELMHYEILWCLDREGFLKDLVFHGGTALRLCYGGNRLSEDLDFTGGPRFTYEQTEGMSAALEKHLVKRYGLEVMVRGPKARREDGRPVRVDTWQISVITDPGYKNLPRQRINIDIATMVAQTCDAQAILSNYSVLPSGLGNLLVPTMSADEIFSNKLVSLPASVHQKRIRFRDIWDLGWLKQNHASLNSHWLKARVDEFGIEDYIDRIVKMKSALPEYLHDGEFSAEMRRFLPQDVAARTLEMEEFIAYLGRSVTAMLDQAGYAYSGKDSDGGDAILFRM